MNTMLQTDRDMPVVARIQKIRTRMRIEALFDVPTASKEIFLSLCLYYEQRLADTEPTGGGEAFWKHHNIAQVWDNGPWTDWTDWTDWTKLSRLR